MSYQVEFAPKAVKQFKKLPRKEQKRIQEKIDSLTDLPRPEGVVKLTDEDNLYRVRVGNYRIIYSIYDEQLLIIILKIAHRQNVY